MAGNRNLWPAAEDSFASPVAPAPVRDVLVDPFYRQGDPTPSIVDPAA